MWPVKLIQNYWSSEGEAPEERMRCVNTKGVFMENWITQNTKPQPEIQSRWWKTKEKDCAKAAFHHQAGRRAFKTSTQLPLNRGVWFPLKMSPVVRTGLRTALPKSSQSFTPSWERDSQQQQISLLTEAPTALKLSISSRNKSMRHPACSKSNWFWFIINNNNVHLQKMQSRFFTAEALGKKVI